MFHIHLDLSALVQLDEELKPAMEAAAAQAAQNLTAQAHAHIVEQVQSKLRSTREKYLDNLGFHQVNETTWVVDLEPAALFIEDGLPPNFDMIDALLDDSPRPGAKGKSGGLAKGKTKTAKDGSRYRIIPFEHNKAPTRQTPAQTDLTNTIKSEMKKMGAPYGKLETDSSGAPKLGLVRKFDIMSKPTKMLNGPGQGKGPIGQVRQGPTGIPLLQGVRVYQRNVTDKKTGKASTKKFILTFRIVSSKHKGQGRWVHPGLEPRKFFDECFEWALKQWEEKIAPELVDDLLTRL